MIPAYKINQQKKIPVDTGLTKNFLYGVIARSAAINKAKQPPSAFGAEKPIAPDRIAVIMVRTPIISRRQYLVTKDTAVSETERFFHVPAKNGRNTETRWMGIETDQR